MRVCVYMCVCVFVCVGVLVCWWVGVCVYVCVCVMYVCVWVSVGIYKSHCGTLLSSLVQVKVRIVGIPLLGDPKIVALINARSNHFNHGSLVVDPDDGYFSDENMKAELGIDFAKSSNWLHSGPLCPTPGQRIMVHMETPSGSNRDFSPSLPLIPVTQPLLMRCGIILRVSM